MKETANCQIDFYYEQHMILCIKTWSFLHAWKLLFVVCFWLKACMVGVCHIQGSYMMVEVLTKAMVDTVNEVNELLHHAYNNTRFSFTFSSKLPLAW